MRLNVGLLLLNCLLMVLSSACTSNAMPASREAMLGRAQLSVVAVGSDGATHGSAWCMAPNRFVTNAHVAQRPNGYLLNSAGQAIGYRIIHMDADKDLAIIEATLPIPALTLATVEPLLGQDIYALGNPFGMGLTVTRGIISALPRSIGKADLLQIDAAVNPGNSGGPVLNSKGQVIGVVSARGAVGSGIGFAVPTDRIAELRDSKD